MPRLDGKVIIVTGGTQGVGEAVAVHAARAGARGVVICGRQQDRGEHVAQELAGLGCEAEYVRADLSSADDCRTIVHRCDEQFGRVDGLVNAAADTNRGTLQDTTVNVRAPFLLVQEASKIMIREHIAGSIVNVLSVAAYCGLEILVSYSSSKGALSTFTKNVANSLRQHRIRVNGINLGWTDTPAEHDVQRAQGSPDNWLELAEQQSPFGRLLKPDDVGHLATYLLSDDSGVLTGSNIDFSQRVMGRFPPETGRPA
jgi:NAD(P)-dependent dehydrogenase (short-subunit alcohol dehydrogenase family)